MKPGNLRPVPAAQFMRKPERLHMKEVEYPTLPMISPQFNPSELKKSIRVNWARHAVPGLSHNVLHYGNTENLSLTLDLFFDADQEGSSVAAIRDADRRLEALCYPNKEGAAKGRPSRLLVVWPKVLTFTGVLNGIDTTFTRFRFDGAATAMTVRLDIQEIRDVRLYAENVRENGTFRSPDGSKVK